MKSVIDVKIVRTPITSSSNTEESPLLGHGFSLSTEMTTVYAVTHTTLFQFQGTGQIKTNFAKYTQSPSTSLQSSNTLKKTSSTASQKTQSFKMSSSTGYKMIKEQSISILLKESVKKRLMETGGSSEIFKGLSC